MGWHVGDMKPDLVLVILDKPRRDGGSGVDLGTRTARVHIARPDGTTLTKAATLADQSAAPGLVAATWASTDLNGEGTYTVQVELDYAGDPQSTPRVSFVVEPSLRPA